MKTKILLVLTAFVFACNSSKKDEKNVQSTLISEEISLDSLALDKIFADSTMKGLEPDEVKNLVKNLVDTSIFYGLTDSFLKIDSLKKSGKYEEYVSKLDIGMFKDIKAIQYKDFDLGSGKTLKIWGYGYDSYEACPYTNGKVLFVNTFEKGKSLTCIPFAYYQNWADAPFFESFKTISDLTKDGSIIIKEFNSSGGVDEKDKEYVNKSTNIIQRSITGNK
jgi:hypothetical protein